MARAIWSGSISFGLVNIPVKLFSAITERNVRFNQIDTRNGARIRTKKVNAEDGTEVPADVIAKGYEISKGRYVLVSDDEMASLQPRATHTIDLEEFVDLVDIDPIYFDGAYYVAPDERAAKSYALLVEAMDAAGKVAVARFVMRSKQYVAVMRPRDGHLVLSMMVYEDEINPVEQIPEFDQLAEVEITQKELAMAEQLIDSLSAEWQPEQFHDSYRDELLDLIDAKDAGEERRGRRAGIAGRGQGHRPHGRAGGVRRRGTGGPGPPSEHRGGRGRVDRRGRGRRRVRRPAQAGGRCPVGRLHQEGTGQEGRRRQAGLHQEGPGQEAGGLAGPQARIRDQEGGGEACARPPVGLTPRWPQAPPSRSTGAG